MSTAIEQLVEVSQYYGQQPAFIIAGGGNTSFKDSRHLWIKASGFNLAEITEEGFCVLDRQKLNELPFKEYSGDSAQREEQVKTDLMASLVNPESGLRPSVETSLHNLLGYAFVVHTHPTIVNALMCSNLAEEKTRELFGDTVLYVAYSDPGYNLFKIILGGVNQYTEKFGKNPKVILIQNHGVFVAADTIEEIKSLYSDIIRKISRQMSPEAETETAPVSAKLTEVLPAIRMIFSEEKIKLARAFRNPWVDAFTGNRETFEKGVARPFTPDQMVYCLSEYLFIGNSETSEAIIAETAAKTEEFKNRRGTTPKVIFIQGEGVVVVEDSAVALNYLEAIVTDFCTISRLSGNFGGPHPLTPSQIGFIENWEVENYRKKVSLGEKPKGRVENKIIIVTGAAQGFGAGIAEILAWEGANIVVADLNEQKGLELSERINQRKLKNKSIFIKTDVSDPASVESMVAQTVQHFGGLDVMISNAGILYAGSLDEMSPETFERMTKVNYTGYFLCAKYAQAMMKIQHRHKPGHFTDIIQINSKSGLKGSNKNFAYAGGKFGGIGLTQSFALELMPFKIKVNAICPGNFFDGPLWSDPEKGLFVQYLKAGKVPGAKTIGEVKAFYESQVPAGRGCTAMDVAKAIFYIVDQEYETGQAVPVTGGQNMLR